MFLIGRVAACMLLLAASAAVNVSPVRAQVADSVCLEPVLNVAKAQVGCNRRASLSASTTSSVSGDYTDPEYPDWRPPANSEWAVWIAWGTTPSGGQCYYSEGMWVPLGTGSAVSLDNSVDIELMKAWQRNGIGDPPSCTEIASILAGGPPAMPSEEVLWDAILAHLPQPDPLWVAPGQALVGLPAWLETNRDLEFELPPDGLAAMPGGQVSVTAEAFFTVDWDDDSPFAESDSAEYRRQGVPFDPDDPDAADGIRHNYTVVPDSGEVTITVTDHWTVQFEDEWGRTATVEGELDESTTIPVIELQAVVTE